MAEDSNELRILILGKASHENRLVRNLLLHQNEPSSQMIEYPFTKRVKFEKYGTDISVTDTPGLMDADYNDSDGVKKNIEYCLKDWHYEAGFHTVVLTFSFPVRWTPEERENFQLIKAIIKENNLKKHGVVVITNCSGLFVDEPDQEVAFEKYIEEECQTSNSFGQVLELVGKRAFFVVNECKSDINKGQIKDLIQSVRRMSKPDNKSKSNYFSLYETSMLAYTGYPEAVNILYSLAGWIMYCIPIPGLYNTFIKIYPNVPKDEVNIDVNEYDMLEDIAS